MKKLFFGDNLEVLKSNIKDASVDLVYLDPPFNSKRDYNQIFKGADGKQSLAQVSAFEDTWHWGPQARDEFNDLTTTGPAKVADLMVAFDKLLGRNDLMAYLVMMTSRLVELHRVLKPTGSLYLHCDPTASHYLKLVLDAVFDPRNFRRELIWRSGWVSGYKAAARNWIRNHDTILYYLKDSNSEYPFKIPKTPHPAGYKRRGGGENPEGVPLDDVWTDIYSPNILSFSKEKLGYPTQKPIALLERIIAASSNPGDVVLDPFCGCGTAVDAAQKLGREWIGIDITHLAITLIDKRLKDRYPGIHFKIEGAPEDLEGARNLATLSEHDGRYQFQWWACSLVGAQPFENKKKGADGGIDGKIHFGDAVDGKECIQTIIVSVKSGKVTREQIAVLKGDVDRETAAMGIFVTLNDPTPKMLEEATKAGVYLGGNGKKYPKIQILTIEDLLNRTKRPEFPDMTMGTATFKQAKRHKQKAGETPLLFPE